MIRQIFCSIRLCKITWSSLLWLINLAKYITINWKIPKCSLIMVIFLLISGVKIVISALDKILELSESQDTDESESALEALGQIGSCKYVTNCCRLRCMCHLFNSLWYMSCIYLQKNTVVSLISLQCAKFTSVNIHLCFCSEARGCVHVRVWSGCSICVHDYA